MQLIYFRVKLTYIVEVMCDMYFPSLGNTYRYIYFTALKSFFLFKNECTSKYILLTFLILLLTGAVT